MSNQSAQRTIRAHVFTDTDPLYFLKQFPGWDPTLDGVTFTFGLNVPQTDIDVLIVYNRASFTLSPKLPWERTAFIAAEPDVIHPYKARYLNQYGIVVYIGDGQLDCVKWQTATCWYWFAGINFERPIQDMHGYDYFAELLPGKKQDKISVVTSNKVFTEYHRKRVRFLDVLKDTIPEHLEIFGRGYRDIADKADALQPYRYHIAIENGAGADAWTEKLADSFLCWSYPFYAGCSNLGRYFPEGSFELLDLERPETEALRMVELVQNGLWERQQNAVAQARQVILQEHNLARLLVRLAHSLAQTPVEATTSDQTIWSERAFKPETGTRGGYGEFVLRNLLLKLDPGIELHGHELRKKLKERRSDRRRD